MKHLIKKYIRSFKVGQNVIDVINEAPVDENKLSEFEQTKMDEYIGIVQT